MAGNCRRIKDMIAQSVSETLAPEQQLEIEEHTHACPSCRAFTEAVLEDDRRLAGLARSLEPSVGRVIGGALGTLDGQARPTVGATGEARPSFWDRIMTLRLPQYAAAAAVVLAMAWVVFHLVGGPEGAAPALADVMRQIEDARSVTYRQSYDFEGMDPFSTTIMVTEPGIMRSILPHGDIVIRDFNTGRVLHLMPGHNKAILTERTGRGARKGIFNYLDWVQTLHRQAGRFVGRETVDGKNANVFVVERSEYHKTTIWADAETDLPIRVRTEALPHANRDVVVPEMSLSASDFGGSEAVTRSISISSPAGIQRKSTTIQQDFHWNLQFDEALFRTTPPEGYELETREFDVSEGGDADLVQALATWVELSQGTFPASINDMGDANKVKPMLIRKFDGDGEPLEELELALAEANKMLKGLFFAQERIIDGNWYYAGAEVRLGDAEVPVCWWKQDEKYRVIYGDLRVEDVGAMPEAAR
jgi:hypothetical protein